MNQDQIEALRQAATAYWNAIEELQSWCHHVATGMGFDGFDNIEAYAEGGGIGFNAYWHGSYGAHDQEGFSFKYSDLLQDPAEVVARLKQERKLAAEKKEQDRIRCEELEQLAQYELLRKKFG